MPRFLAICTVCSVFTVSAVCFGQAANTEIPSRYTYVPRNLSREGDYKVVVVPATNPRQARLDAQTYHIGWDAIEARKGQSRVMYDVLLKKRAPYVPGTPPVTRRIPK
jgi:hypothetical protein